MYSEVRGPGPSQVPGFDFDPNKTYAPTASSHSTIMIMAEAATGDWEHHHEDVNQASIQAPGGEEIYIELAANYHEFEGAVGKLNHSMY